MERIPATSGTISRTPRNTMICSFERLSGSELFVRNLAGACVVFAELSVSRALASKRHSLGRDFSVSPEPKQFNCQWRLVLANRIELIYLNRIWNCHASCSFNRRPHKPRTSVANGWNGSSIQSSATLPRTARGVAFLRDRGW